MPAYAHVHVYAQALTQQRKLIVGEVVEVARPQLLADLVDGFLVRPRLQSDIQAPSELHEAIVRIDSDELLSRFLLEDPTHRSPIAVRENEDWSVRDADDEGELETPRLRSLHLWH